MDHNAPLIKLSRKLTKLASKPRITKGLLNSIKTKNKLYKKAMNSSGIASEFQKYRKFNNILTHLKKKAKLNFYKTQLFENSNTPRETWKQSIKQLAKTLLTIPIPFQLFKKLSMVHPLFHITNLLLQF